MFANRDLRLALFEFNKLIAEGIPEEEFERTKSFVDKYSSLLLKTKSAIDWPR